MQNISSENHVFLPNILLDFGKGKINVYNKNATILDIFEEQVKKNPNNIAVCFENKTLTYNELNSKANQLAHFLLKKGLSPKEHIALHLENSIETIIGLLAILKIGCCYVPLDPLYPSERLTYMLKDSGASAVITQANLLSKFSINEITIIDIADDKIHEENTTNTNISLSADDTAYLIYTSGSTGKPKGVKISHRAVNNHMFWMQKHFGFDKDQVFLFRTPLSFDPSVWEIFMPFYIGAKLVIAPLGENIIPEKLIQIVNKNQVTVIQLVPTLLREFLKQEEVVHCHSLKHVFCGGETLPSDTKRLFFNILKCQLHNLYGPTEATIDITSYTFQPNEFDINNNIIGSPIYNTQLLVLNDKMEVCSIEEIGELYIASDSLSQGYHNLDAVTKKKFINFYIPSIGKLKLYKTGDRVRWLRNGCLEYIGRRDEQIKINGVRIEIQEIEAFILNIPSVASCKVLKKVKDNGYEFLVCYLVPNDYEKFDFNEVSRLLKGFFPVFMLPKEYVVHEKFPLTANGKVDVQALSKSESKAKNNDNEYSLDFYEMHLKSIYEELLNQTDIHIEDNFFELGGHSFLILQLAQRIEEKMKCSISIRDIFLTPTVKDLAKLIRKSIIEKSNFPDFYLTKLNDPIIPLQAKGNLLPLFLVHPIGGTVFWYKELAECMGDSRPIYGIQDPGIESKQPPFTSIQDMAAFYVQAIVKLQPEGPYILGGASFGATVALEMAYLLKNQGKNILAIIILDGWGVYPSTLLDANYFKQSMERQQFSLRAQFLAHGMIKIEHLFELQWHRLGLLWDYRVKNIPFPIALYKAKELLPAFAQIDDSLNHWGKFAKDSITLYKVTGNHETMFYEPHVYNLAQLMNDYLKTLGN